MTLVIYSLPDDAVLASLHMLKRECSAMDGRFASCRIDARESRRSGLRVLVLGLPEGEDVVYGCNVTTFRPEGRVTIFTWSVVVRVPAGKRTKGRLGDWFEAEDGVWVGGGGGGLVVRGLIRFGPPSV